MTNLFTVKELAEARGTSWVVREALLALEAENIRLREALELADAALKGANMDMNVVERKVRAILGESHD